ncbi:hypothetical protein EV182_000937 [Spiromyces aspiralis]|uniref:Uncharacterized protein n=1 Tax=Spiromyces aspiralis TaxID=68401 RepID=A0ACC1HXB7_9FUNG|nr:hypothetical protein EV182_000937 [Spiromyces aspiralis]
MLSQKKQLLDKVRSLGDHQLRLAFPLLTQLVRHGLLVSKDDKGNVELAQECREDREVVEAMWDKAAGEELIENLVMLAYRTLGTDRYNNIFQMLGAGLAKRIISTCLAPRFSALPQRSTAGALAMFIFTKEGLRRQPEVQTDPEWVELYIRMLGYCGDADALERGLGEISIDLKDPKLNSAVICARARCFQAEKARQMWDEAVAQYGKLPAYYHEAKIAIALCLAEIGDIERGLKFLSEQARFNADPLAELDKGERLEREALYQLQLYEAALRTQVAHHPLTERFHTLASTRFGKPLDYRLRTQTAEHINTLFGWRDIESRLLASSQLPSPLIQEALIWCASLANIISPSKCRLEEVEQRLENVVAHGAVPLLKTYQQLLWMAALSRQIKHRERSKLACRFLTRAKDAHPRSLNPDVFLPTLVACLPPQMIFGSKHSGISRSSFKMPHHLDLHRHAWWGGRDIFGITGLMNHSWYHVSTECIVAIMWFWAASHNLPRFIKVWERAVNARNYYYTPLQPGLQVFRNEWFYTQIFSMLSARANEAHYALTRVRSQMRSESTAVPTTVPLVVAQLNCCAVSANFNKAKAVMRDAEQAGIAEDPRVVATFACAHFVDVCPEELAQKVCEQLLSDDQADIDDNTYYAMLRYYARRTPDLKTALRVYDHWLASDQHTQRLSPAFRGWWSGVNSTLSSENGTRYFDPSDGRPAGLLDLSQVAETKDTATRHPPAPALVEHEYAMVVLLAEAYIYAEQWAKACGLIDELCRQVALVRIPTTTTMNALAGLAMTCIAKKNAAGFKQALNITALYFALNVGEGEMIIPKFSRWKYAVMELVDALDTPEALPLTKNQISQHLCNIKDVHLTKFLNKADLLSV